jgi:(4S)-4-hydroxy-5-phosphonooxypentane-2,3-dione isomerase
MIVRIVKLTIEPDRFTTFMKCFDDVKEQIRTFKGCLHMELLRDITSSGIVFTYSLWENEACLENYRKSELFNNTWKTVKPLFRSRAEAWSLEKYDLV